MKHNISYGIFLWIASLITAACSEWIDVKPKNRIEAEEMLSKGVGYETALNGIYQEISEKSVYGQELSWGFLSVIAQDYASPSGNPEYKDARHYRFESIYLSPLIDDIWSKMSNALANTNFLLDNIASADTNIFELKSLEKNLIQGEALALRAMINFELLRLFAPAPILKESKAFLPYINTFPSLYELPVSTDKFLNLAIDDLKKAKNLLATCDTLERYSKWIGSTSTRLEGYSDYSGRGKFFSYRSTRLNYIATTCLLARVYQYAGMEEKAYAEAKEVIDIGYRFTPSHELNPYDPERADRKMHHDIMFALFNNKMPKILASYYEEKLNSPLIIQNPEDVFGEDKNDYRKIYLTTTLENNKPICIRWKTSSDEGTARVQKPLIPIIRLSEMYYIAAETIFDKDPEKAIDYLNTVRRGRGNRTALPVPSSKDELINHIINDARREYMTEGQVFFLYKRTNKEIVGAPVKSEIRYVLPIPSSNDVSLNN